MTSHQPITVPDYNWITISSNDPLGVVWSNYSVSLNKMADSWWFEETKLLIALWREEAVQHELNTMHKKKLAWDKISQGMADIAYLRSAQQCRVKINNLKQKYRKIRDGNKISGNQRQEWEMFELMDRALGCKPTSKPTVVVNSMVTLPSLFEFSQMWTEP